MNNKKVLVTGATGFFGQHLVARLHQMGAEITILARETSNLKGLKPFFPKVVIGDILKTQSHLKATEDKDIVFHLAGVIAYKKSMRSMMNKVNVLGTQNVMDACITNKVSKVLHLSSVTAVGANPRAVPLNEESPYELEKFDLGYFETKRAAEKIAYNTFKDHGVPVYIINPATIYGAGDAEKGSRKTQIQVARGKFPFYTPGGVNVVYVQDVLDLIFLILEKGKPGRRYIAAGDNMTIKELFATIAEAGGVAPPKIGLPRLALKTLGAFGDILTKFGKQTPLSSETAITSSYFHWYDNSRAKDELGFDPKPSRQAIFESVQWMKDQKIIP